MVEKFNKFLPDGIHEIDHSHPLAANLKHAWIIGQDSVGGKVRDLVGNLDGTIVGSASLQVGEYGRELDIPTLSDYISCGDIGSDYVNDGYSAVVVGNGVTTSPATSLCGYGGTNFGWVLTWEEFNGTGKIGYAQIAVANNQSSLFTPTATSAVGLTRRTSGTQLAANGVLAAAVIAAAATGPPTGTPNFVIGTGWRAGTAIDPLQGQVSACFLFNPELTNAELADITKNPWQILKKRSAFFGFSTAAITGFKTYFASQTNRVIQ